jgi:hypothetical protein
MPGEEKPRKRFPGRNGVVSLPNARRKKEREAREAVRSAARGPGVRWRLECGRMQHGGEAAIVLDSSGRCAVRLELAPHALRWRVGHAFNAAMNLLAEAIRAEELEPSPVWDLSRDLPRRGVYRSRASWRGGIRVRAISSDGRCVWEEEAADAAAAEAIEDRMWGYLDSVDPERRDDRRRRGAGGPHLSLVV